MAPQQEFSNNMEQIFHQDLHRYLTSIDLVDSHFPDLTDIEDQWLKIGESYLPDGMREFGKYPTVSLGWIMFIGMAIAKYWDEDWELYSKVPDLYKYLKERIDFDHLDDYICEKVLLLDKEQHQALSKIVAECASRTINTIRHQTLEPGTPEAFRTFIAALHQMYMMGAAIELKALGYHMKRI